MTPEQRTTEGMTGQAPSMGHMLAAMEKSAGKGVRIAYMVVAILFALMMFFSASFKLTNNPDAVHLIHEVIGVPLALIPVLALCEIAGGLGLLAGILRPSSASPQRQGSSCISSERWWLT